VGVADATVRASDRIRIGEFVWSQAIAPAGAASQRLVQITGGRGNAVLVSEEDWRAVQETLYLLSIPGMRESIREGLATPIDDLEDEPGW
jgi:antitoxin YefM